MNVLLVMPPFAQFKYSVKRCVQPLGLLSIAAYLERAGHSVEVLDSVVEGYHQDRICGDVKTYGLSMAKIADHIRDSKPDFVGVSCLMTPLLKDTLEICQITKQIDDSIQTIVGGVHATFAPYELLQYEQVDHVVIGEGEQSILSIVNGEKSGVVQSPLLDVDMLPMPARHLVSMQKYFDIAMPENTFSPYKRTVQLESSRGCPFSCSFCATSKHWGRKFRGKNPEIVIKEIRHLKEKYDVDELDFVDPNIAFDKLRFKKLLELLIKENLGIAWGNCGGIWVDGLDTEILDLCKQSGCYQISLAVENVNPHILKDVIHKPIHLERVKTLVEHCKKIGLDLHAFFVTGFPEETLKDMWRNYEFAKEMDFTSASFNIITPIPGSELYEKYASHLDLTCINFNKASIPNPDLTPEEIKNEIEKMNIKFNRSLLWRQPVMFARKYLYHGWLRRKKNFWKMFRRQ